MRSIAEAPAIDMTIIVQRLPGARGLNDMQPELLHARLRPVTYLLARCVPISSFTTSQSVQASELLARTLNYEDTTKAVTCQEIARLFLLCCPYDCALAHPLYVPQRALVYIACLMSLTQLIAGSSPAPSTDLPEAGENERLVPALVEHGHAV